jgi:hypothetical protein
MDLQEATLPERFHLVPPQPTIQWDFTAKPKVCGPEPRHAQKSTVSDAICNAPRLIGGEVWQHEAITAFA